MNKSIPYFPSILFVLAVSVQAADWNVLRTYEFGNDLTPLIAIEKEVRQSTATPQARAETAEKLASFLAEDTPYPGRQFACMQLRFVATAKEVPALARLLESEQDSENARMVLQKISGEEALVPLRKALKTFKGRALCGIIESLAARKDVKSLPDLTGHLKSDDPNVVAAATAALGAFGGEGEQALERAKGSVPEFVRSAALLRIAGAYQAQGDAEKAKKLYTELTDREVPSANRRAAYSGILSLLPGEERKKTIYQWFFDDSAEKNIVAATYLHDLSEEQLNSLFSRVSELSTRSKIVFYEFFAEREDKRLVETLRKAMEGNDPVERLSAVRAIGKTRDGSLIPYLLEALKQDDAMRTAAMDAFRALPVDLTGDVLLKALEMPDVRNQVLELLAVMKYYNAINPLIKMAQTGDTAVCEPVIAALGKLCDPDDSDIPRMIELYFLSRPGAHREQVERAIVVISERDSDENRRGDRILKHLEKRKDGLSEDVLITVLPLLGKLGNKKIAEIVLPMTRSDNPAARRAAVRALCNWPNAGYLEDLWKIATEDASPQYRQWALRAYVRVATLKSERPESETLAMLQKAIKAAVTDSDKQWCLSRAVAIRTMPSVEWAASYLDDPVLAQTACSVLADLGHHRFLREPNKDKFDPILLKVERTARDKDIVEHVKKSRLGM